LYSILTRHLWSQTGSSHVGLKFLSKGPITTHYFGHLHSYPHDFNTGAASRRKIYSSGLSHISICFVWIGGMYLHGAYFTNYGSWLLDPTHILPSAHYVSPLVGQSIINASVGGYHTGLNGASGLFYLMRSYGIVSLEQMKALILLALWVGFFSLVCAYINMHVISPCRGFTRKLKALSWWQFVVLAGLASLSWCGHQVHVSVPLNRLLALGVYPGFLPSLNHDMFYYGGLSMHFWGDSCEPIGALEPHTSSLPLDQIATHHFYVGVCFILIGIFVVGYGGPRYLSPLPVGLGGHANLSINLCILGSLSIAWAYSVFSLPSYPGISTDYMAISGIYSLHLWLGWLFYVGASAHGAIAVVRDSLVLSDGAIFAKIFGHRDVLLAHLIWVSVFLGFHSFCLFIHNDTLESLGRAEDTFSDSGICIRPIFASLVESVAGCDIEIVDGKIGRAPVGVGTCDILVHHLHAFTIHTTLLVLVKGLLYARTSRLVADKATLGFSYACDGPGRGGTCMLSPWDHIYLGLFWTLNAVSVETLYFYWKMRGEFWGTYVDSTSRISHVMGSTLSRGAGNINGWLRDLLWTQSFAIINSYGTSKAGYGLSFLYAHFVWALSLMFLFSGRGYWQELIEAVLWAHKKVEVVPRISVLALNISQGRAVGLSHYIIGTVGCTWAFMLV